MKITVKSIQVYGYTMKKFRILLKIYGYTMKFVFFTEVGDFTTGGEKI